MGIAQPLLDAMLSSSQRPHQGKGALPATACSTSARHASATNGPRPTLSLACGQRGRRCPKRLPITSAAPSPPHRMATATTPAGLRRHRSAASSAWDKPYCTGPPSSSRATPWRCGATSAVSAEVGKCQGHDHLREPSTAAFTVQPVQLCPSVHTERGSHHSLDTHALLHSLLLSHCNANHRVQHMPLHCGNLTVAPATRCGSFTMPRPTAPNRSTIMNGTEAHKSWARQALSLYGSLQRG
jgi:hypothetical protein